MFKLRKYHNNRVQSLTYEGDENSKSFSVGIIYPGTYDFGSIQKEITTVTSGKISVWTSQTNKWETYQKDETFTIPEHTEFKFKCDEVSSYICFYE